MKSINMKTVRKLALIALLSTFSLQGCDILINTLGEEGATVETARDKVPVIAAFDYSPKTAVSKEDFITFTVVANDPEGEALQYTWTSTKGTLTSNSGSSVAWRPLKADGTFEPGLSTVTLIVSDGKMTSSATANIMISEEGTASIQNTEIKNTPESGSEGSSDDDTLVTPDEDEVKPTPKPTPKPVPTPEPTPPIDNSNATGTLKQGGSVLPYYQLDFTTRFNYKTDLGVIKADGVPVSGYKDGNANITLLSMGQTPFGEAFPPKFYWDVNNFNTKFLLMTSSFSWWGEAFAGEKFATLTVESTDGSQEVFELVVGTHVAEWNGGSLTENPPAVRIMPAPPGSGESRAFVTRFDLKETSDVKRISVELLKAPMWNNNEYAAWFIKGITLVGEWQI